MNVERMESLARVAALLLCAAGAASLSGCNKAELEAQKTRADASDQKVKQLEADLGKSKTDLAAAMTRAQQAESQLNVMRSGAVLVTMIDGKIDGRDTIRWDGTQFVRHGDRVRSNGVVKFDSGRVADQTMLINRESGKPWFTGATKNSRPDGEWIWFDKDGKPQTKEVWADGTLTDVQRASISREGKVTWAKLSKADRDAWAKSTSGTFVNLPELVRNTAAPAGTSTTSTNDPKPGTKPAGTKSGKPSSVTAAGQH